MVNPIRTGLVAWVLGMAFTASAQIVALEPEQAGPDYPYQGEYLGEGIAADGKKQAWAAQVSALGSGNFRAVFYPMGFPGAGWNATGRVEATGKLGGTKVDVAGSGFAVSLAGGKLSGTGPANLALQMDKVLRASPTLGMKAPANATVLFDGSGVDAWKNGVMDARGLLGVPSETRKSVGAFSLHLEFRLPFQPFGRGQGRANSGFCMPTGGWSELQVLDSFGEEPLVDGCGALYNTAKPKVNACLPPLAWQTYDIQFTQPVLQNGTRVQEAKITVWLNGIAVQEKTPLANRPLISVLLLQDHTNPVFYRNIWMVEGRDDFNFFPASGIAVREGRRGIFLEDGRTRTLVPGRSGGSRAYRADGGIFALTGRFLGPERNHLQ